METHARKQAAEGVVRPQVLRWSKADEGASVILLSWLSRGNERGSLSLARFSSILSQLLDTSLIALHSFLFCPSYVDL